MVNDHLEPFIEILISQAVPIYYSLRRGVQDAAAEDRGVNEVWADKIVRPRGRRELVSLY